MNKLSNLLWKMFCSFMVFSHHDYANAIPFYGLVISKPTVTTQIDTPLNTQPKTQINLQVRPSSALRKKHCQANQYVKQCGQYVIGTYWLKGISYTKNSETISTPDYFDYSSNATTINAQNLKKFIAGKDGFSYTNASGEVKNVTVNDYAEHRKTILEQLCNPSTTTITCADCPDGGFTSTASYITTNKFTAIPTEWDINIALDCSMNTFKDSTGTFVYVQDEKNTNVDGIACFYTPTDFFGSKLPKDSI